VTAISRFILFILLFFLSLFSLIRASESDSIAFARAACQCSLRVANGLDSLRPDLEAAKELAQMGMVPDALQMLEKCAANTRDTISIKKKEPVKHSWKAWVGMGADYYHDEDSDTSLTSLLSDSLIDDSDKPLEIFGEAGWRWTPNRFYVKQLEPYFRFSNQQQKERFYLALGPRGAAGATLQMMESYTRRVDEPEKDSLDLFEWQSVLSYSFPIALNNMDLIPHLKAGFNAEHYRFDRSTTPSKQKPFAGLGLDCELEPFSAGIEITGTRETHAPAFDSLDLYRIRPAAYFDYFFSFGFCSVQWNQERSYSMASNRNPEGYMTLDFSLEVEPNQKFSVALLSQWERDEAGFGDTFYLASDTLFSRPEMMINYDSLTPDTVTRNYETLFQKYAMSGSRFSVGPVFTFHWNETWSSTLHYTFEKGDYAKLNEIGGHLLEYPVDPLDDSFKSHRIEAGLLREGNCFSLSLFGAFERRLPDGKHPLTPKNTAWEGTLDTEWTLPLAFRILLLGGLERRDYESLNEAPAYAAWNKSGTLTVRKDFP